MKECQSRYEAARGKNERVGSVNQSAWEVVMEWSTSRSKKKGSPRAKRLSGQKFVRE